jgi:hypothetical protein
LDARYSIKLLEKISLADVLKEGPNSITEIFFKGTYCRRNQEKMEEDGEAEHIMPRGNDLHGCSAFRR